MKKLLILLVLMVSLFAKVNINTANINKLESLKGIGKAKAESIIEYRKQHKFKKIEDIMKVKGIGKKLFEKIKDEINVDKANK